MFHVPILCAEHSDYRIEFCHINANAHTGTWANRKNLCLNNIKINLFMQGDFYIVFDDKCCQPIYGDLWLLPPFKVHHGKITKPTHTDYYQLDIGTKALDGITGGTQLIERFICNCNRGCFFRPLKNDITQLIQLCDNIEKALTTNAQPLAFAYTIELLNRINIICEQNTSCTASVLSRLTGETIKYIETHFPEYLTIDQMADSFGVSASYLSRLFKKEVGVGIHEYLTTHRITQASYLLLSHTVTEVCYLCGFSNSSHFISVFRKYFDCTPREYQKRKS